MTIMGDYLMYKCYPDYTAHRLGMPLDRDTDPELGTDKHKGRAITVGLWMFATDSREPMKDVLMRLNLLDIQAFYLVLKVFHRLRDYIKRGEPYPERFRYGPEHPPPPNHNLRISNDSSPEQTPEGDPYISHTFSPMSHTMSQSQGPRSRSHIHRTRITAISQPLLPCPKSTSYSRRLLQNSFNHHRRSRSAGVNKVSHSMVCSPRPCLVRALQQIAPRLPTVCKLIPHQAQTQTAWPFWTPYLHPQPRNIPIVTTEPAVYNPLYPLSR